jgi:hypothetical protein
MSLPSQEPGNGSSQVASEKSSSVLDVEMGGVDNNADVGASSPVVGTPVAA